MQIIGVYRSSQLYTFKMKNDTATRRKIRSIRRDCDCSRRQVDTADVVRLPPDRDVQLIGEHQFETIVRGLSRTETEEGISFWRDGHPWQYVRTGREVVVRNHHDHAPVRYYYIA